MLRSCPWNWSRSISWSEYLHLLDSSPRSRSNKERYSLVAALFRETRKGNMKYVNWSIRPVAVAALHNIAKDLHFGLRIVYLQSILAIREIHERMDLITSELSELEWQINISGSLFERGEWESSVTSELLGYIRLCSQTSKAPFYNAISCQHARNYCCIIVDFVQYLPNFL
jgi:hypothetical protein